MALKCDWQPLSEKQAEALKSICPRDEYRVIAPAQVPSGCIAPALLEKCNSVLVACSGTGDGRMYVMYNLNRIDGANIDQQPYGIAFDGSRPLPSGLMGQHGNYPGRTTTLPTDFYQHVAQSGLYPLAELPANSSGPLSDLKIDSQTEAHRLLASYLDTAFPPTI